MNQLTNVGVSLDRQEQPPNRLSSTQPSLRDEVAIRAAQPALEAYTDSELGLDVAALTAEAMALGGLHSLARDIQTVRQQLLKDRLAADEAAYQYEVNRFSDLPERPLNPQFLNLRVNVKPLRSPYFAS